MNKNILQKVLTELGKEKPSIDYLKGMVETLIEMSGETVSITSNDKTITPVFSKINTSKVDEEYIPEHLRAGPIGNIG